MPDIDREFSIGQGRMANLPFGSIGGISALPANEGQPARVKLYIELPGREGGAHILPLGATFTLDNGTWVVAEINSPGTPHWSARLCRVD
ncbi:DUF6406 domain-containing protein [Streptomyces sp. NPDC127190]|uniref:DUF6406 domain-containing protein n=1 Tax=unclassified Streptomyces TaxID=2593676 RepID=UPI00362CD5D4